MADTGAPLFLEKMALDGERLPSARFNTNMELINAYFEAIGSAWEDWTPTWTNLTLGNGTVVAKYAQIGKLVFCRLSLVFGSTTSVSGDIMFSLPVTAVSYAGTAGVTPIGVATFLDTGTATFDARVSIASTTGVALRVLDASGTYLKQAVTSSTVPFTWTNLDEIACEFFYEAA